MKFKEGDKVFHRSFGRGKVVGIEDDSYTVKFDSLETDRNVRKDFLGLVPCGNEDAARELIDAAGLVRVMRGYLENKEAVGDRARVLALTAQLDAIQEKIRKGLELLP